MARERRLDMEDVYAFYEKAKKDKLVLDSATKHRLSQSISTSVIDFELRGVTFSVNSTPNTLNKFMTKVYQERFFDEFGNKNLNAHDLVQLARGGGVIHPKLSTSMGEGLITVTFYQHTLSQILAHKTISELIEDDSPDSLETAVKNMNLLSKIIKKGRLIEPEKIKAIASARIH